MEKSSKFLAISIPTGIGLEFGGWAGDFGSIAREFSRHFNLIINPNAVNGGILSAINQNMLYTEGFAFDEFLCGRINLVMSQKPNKIGVILDCAIPENILNIHINTINALKTVCGIDILPQEITKEPAGVEFSINKETKISSGSVKNPASLLDAAKKLVAQGASAIAVVCYFEDCENEDDTNYINAKGVDPIGGVEAVISHFLVKELNLPCAHSPAFCALEISEKIENPKVAAELISSTYLPCVVKGLEFAPQFSRCGGISNKDIAGLVVPLSALGSGAVLGAHKNNIPIYAVENQSQLNVGCKELKLSGIMQFESYKQCLEYLKGEYYG